MQGNAVNAAPASRTVYFDHLRVFATILIIVRHVAALRWYDTDIFSNSWLILNAFKSLTGHAVLLFVMISGALFLSRDIPIKKIYLKYVLRIVIAFIVWSFIYALIFDHSSGIGSVIKTTLASHYHLWFLPMIVGLYICIPILRLIIRDDKITRYFLILSFIFAFFIPQILNILSDFGTGTLAECTALISDRINDMHMNLVMGYTFFFISGYYINKTEISKTLRRVIYLLGAIGVLVTFFITMLNSRQTLAACDTYHENFNIAILFTCLATFVFFKYNIGKKENRFITRLSKYSFGVYLVHTLILEKLYTHFNISALSFNAICGTLLVSAVTVLLAFAVSALLNLIPVIKKYIV